MTACACEHCGHEFEAEPERGHHITCGDSLNILPALLDQIGALITDPPYGIGFNYDQHNDSPDGYGAWLWSIIESAEALCAPGSPVFVWQASLNIRKFAEWFPRDWRLFCAAKNFVQMRPTAMQYAYDPVIVWWKQGAKPWSAKKHEGSVSRDWHIADTASTLAKSDLLEKKHPCPRPADQVAYILRQWCPPDQIVLDPFGGSGTTIIAGEMASRAVHVIEISPAYCDIAVRRWSKFTGRAAVLADDGRTFDEVAAHRRPEQAVA